METMRLESQKRMAHLETIQVHTTLIYQICLVAITLEFIYMLVRQLVRAK